MVLLEPLGASANAVCLAYALLQHRVRSWRWAGIVRPLGARVWDPNSK
jgi:hypothetical protein